MSQALTPLFLLCLLLPAQAPAQRLAECGFEGKADKFDDSQTWSTPYKRFKTPRWPGFSRISFTQRTTKRGGERWASFSVDGSQLTTGARGLTILLADGTKIDDPAADVAVDVSSYTGWAGYRYTVTISLNAGRLQQLARSPITDFRVSTQEAQVPKGYAARMLTYAQCLNAVEWPTDFPIGR